MSLLDSIIPSRQRALARDENGPALSQTVKPLYELNEAKDGYDLAVYLPGVAKEGLELTAENERLTIVGRRAWKQPEGWTTLYGETIETPYELVLEHDNAVDLEKIHAEIHDGVLRVSLPKAEALKPRKIAVG